MIIWIFAELGLTVNTDDITCLFPTRPYRDNSLSVPLSGSTGNLIKEIINDVLVVNKAICLGVTRSGLFPSLSATGCDLPMRFFTYLFSCGRATL